MVHIDLSSDEDFSQKLLDTYAELIELSAVLYIDEGGDGSGDGSSKVFYSKKYWPAFCRKIFKIPELNDKCLVCHSKAKKQLYRCYAGLWCYAQPVKVNEDVVGTYVVGHRRIKGREKESKYVLEKTLSKYKVNDENSNRLRELLEKVDAVDEGIFNIKFFDRISFIEQLVIMEHHRATDLKKESVSLAHVFLLPIQSVIADAENLFNEAKEISELRDMAEDILQQVTKLYFIAENIRGSVLEEHDEVGYEFYDADIHPIIHSAVDLFRKQAKKKGVTIKDPEMKYSSSIIEMSEPHMEIVFFNLIHNAVKYSFTSIKQSERYLTVVCKPDGKFYCIEISNYGVGIKPEEIKEGLIFENGYRGKLARDRSRTGSGVGLSTVKRVIEAHNGYIKVDSKPVGAGLLSGPYLTTVKVCIPFRQSKGGSPYGNKKDIMGRR